MDVNDEEIFLCKISSKNAEKNNTYTWFKSDHVPRSLINIFKQKFDTNFENNKKKEDDHTYKTDKGKVYSCDLKTRTCGIQVLCSNCGVILGFKELFGSESYTQVASMLLEFKEVFNGNFKYAFTE